ncbi:glycosyltransferase family 2 protein [Shewanella baltica]|uniref:glycosyltransferase family 2 protein n=1 Tax=Shewanella baltica TaxID=62322 RepID=UPI003D79583C
MKKPKISVIMTAYNSEKYIKEAIESILWQTYSDFELIIVNDGSNDLTLDIIYELQKSDSRIKVIDKKNTGIIDSANLGLKLAQGDYVARMDSDDISHPTRFYEQVKFLNDNTDVTAVSSAVLHIGNCSNFSFPSTQTDQLNFIPELVNPALMFRRKDILKYNIDYKSEHLYAEDCGFLYSLVKAGLKLSNLDLPLLLYRVHNKSVTRLFSEIQTQSANLIITERFNFINTDRMKDVFLKRIKFNEYNDEVVKDFLFIYKHLILSFPKKYVSEYFLSVLVKVLLFNTKQCRLTKDFFLLSSCLISGLVLRSSTKLRSLILTIKYRNFWRGHYEFK